LRIPKNKALTFKDQHKLSMQQHQFVDAMADANIPVAYWMLPMSSFAGSDDIKQTVYSYVGALKQNYNDGQGFIFAGPYGVGKTYGMCSVLKTALRAGYSAYYTSITDMSLYIGSRATRDEYLRLCTKSDFIAFDELDSRHIPTSEDGRAFFGSAVEKIIRERAQNKLPTLFATNHESLKPVFDGQYGRAILSLLAPVSKTVTALGLDFRQGRGRS